MHSSVERETGSKVKYSVGFTMIDIVARMASFSLLCSCTASSPRLLDVGMLLF